MWYVRIGSRLRGPFDEEQLKLLRKRGELSSFHQVSQDQKTWQAAGDVFKQWENAPRVESLPITTAPAPAGCEDDWYFASPNGESVGPVSKQQLGQLATAGQITAKTLVYGPGLSAWTEASSIDFLIGKATNPSRRLAIPILLISCLTLALLGTASYVIYLAVNRASNEELMTGEVLEDALNTGEQDTDMQLAKKSAPHRTPGNGVKINSVSHKQLKQALARVQIIKRVQFANGSIVEMPVGHGTGFCVTPTGYFLTNRHVIEPYSDKVEQGTLMIGGTPREVRRDMSIVLFVQGIRFDAMLVHASTRFDLAVVKINRLQALPYFELSSGNEPPLLMDVFALGFPGVAATPSEAEEAGLSAKFVTEYTRAIADKCTVTAESQLPESAFGHSAVPGSITKTGRSENGQLFVYHSASIFGGNSGGPLVDKRGLVIGINTAIRRDLDVTEVTLSDGSKGVMAINDGNLNQSYLTGQFREELRAYIPEKLHWK